MDMQDINDAIERHDLIRLQNHTANVDQDHLSICWLFTTEEQFVNHAAKLRKYAAAWLSNPRRD